MARYISFAMTTEQIRNRSKTVTRRLKWLNLRRGQVLTACVKCMGFRAGEKIERLCQIRVVGVNRERLSIMEGTTYGSLEAAKEGFPNLTGIQFVEMFCGHMRCGSDTMVTRIEFEYLEGFDNG